jgi:hypothetical protein
MRHELRDGPDKCLLRKILRISKFNHDKQYAKHCRPHFYFKCPPMAFHYDIVQKSFSVLTTPVQRRTLCTLNSYIQETTKDNELGPTKDNE